MGGTHTHEHEHYGFRIYSVFENSPFSELSFSPLADFIIPPSNTNEEKYPFFQFIHDNEGKEVELTLLNYLTGHQRTVKVTPSKRPDSDSLLGLKVRQEILEKAWVNVIQVTEIDEESLAEEIGLKAGEFITGLKRNDTDIISLSYFKKEELKEFVVEFLFESENEFVTLYVINVEKEGREVTFRMGKTLGAAFSIGDDYHLKSKILEE